MLLIYKYRFINLVQFFIVFVSERLKYLREGISKTDTYSGNQKLHFTTRHQFGLNYKTQHKYEKSHTTQHKCPQATTNTISNTRNRNRNNIIKLYGYYNTSIQHLIRTPH